MYLPNCQTCLAHMSSKEPQLKEAQIPIPSNAGTKKSYTLPAPENGEGSSLGILWEA